MLCANVCVHVLVCSCSNDVFSSDFVSVTGDFHSSISRTASSHEFTCHRRAFIMLPITPAHERASADTTTEIYACHCLQGDACALSQKCTREGTRGYTASSPDADCKGQYHTVAQRLLQREQPLLPREPTPPRFRLLHIWSAGRLAICAPCHALSCFH